MIKIESFVRVLLVYCALSKCCTAYESRIVGGSTVKEMEIKYQVSIRSKSSDQSAFGRGHICGGSLISAGTVLTAAHCLVDSKDSPRLASYFRVVGGSIYRNIQTENTFISDVKKIVVHNKYNSNGFLNDVGVMLLLNIVGINHPTLQPVSTTINVPVNGTRCVTSGWGSIYFDGPSTDILKAVNISVISNEQCNKASSYAGSILKGMICAGNMSGGEDACQGDSGGPLVCNGLLAGIVSHGVDCARPGFPGVYSDVAYYRDWIQKNESSVIQISMLTTYLSIIYSTMLCIMSSKLHT